MTARALAAETIGTALLVAAVVGSGIMADGLTADTALALLANTAATAAALVVPITIFGPLSGAQFNPVVTMVMALRGEMPASRVLPYIAAQILGGFLGTLFAHAMFDLPLLQTSSTIRTGTSQWIAEGVASFGLILTILGTLRANGNVAATVADYIAAAYWFTSSTSFANPAVTIARTLTDSFAGIRPMDAPGFILAQIAGALLALAIGNWLFKRD